VTSCICLYKGLSCHDGKTKSSIDKGGDEEGSSCK